MKTLRNLILLLVPVILFSGKCILAQESQPLDKTALPIGGIEAIMKNVVYPKEALKDNIQGKVIIVATIDEKGNVEKVKVEKSVDKLLDAAAEAAIKKTKFIPGELNGEKVKCDVTIPVLFKLS